jgi:hypothetical protein
MGVICDHEMGLEANSVDRGCSYEDSAYVQNLAEICHMVMNDMRWRVPNSSIVSPLANVNNPKGSDKDHSQRKTINAESLRLFTLVNGDNIDAVWEFQKLFKSKPVDTEPISFFPAHSSANHNSPAAESGRFMHLYARMFYRKGPWFTIDDLFFRYYWNKCFDFPVNNNFMEMEGIIVDRMRRSLECFFADIQHLLRAGFIRTFESDDECAKFTTSRREGGVLHRNDVTELHRRMSMRASTEDSSESVGIGVKLTATKKVQTKAIPKVLKGQQRISFPPIKPSTKSSCKASSSSDVSIVQHLEYLILRNMCDKLSDELSTILNQKNSKEKSNPDLFHGPELKKMWEQLLQRYNIHKVESLNCFEGGIFIQPNQMLMMDSHSIQDDPVIGGSSCNEVKSSLGHMSFVTCICLSDEPLLTLRRAARLILCAGSGPGAMRWDGKNAWISVENHDVDIEKCNHSTNGRNIRSPSNSQWYHVEYPGLKHRLGLQDYHFMNCYRPHIWHDSSQITCMSSGRSYNTYKNSIHIFQSTQSFHAWEWCVDVRCWVDYLLEDKRCKLEGTLPKKFYLSSKQIRDSFIHSFQTILDPSSSNAKFWSSVIIHSDVVIASLPLETTAGDIYTAENDNHENFVTHLCCSIAIVCNYILLFRLKTVDDTEMIALIHRPWLRHLSWESVLAYILWGCVEIFEKKGRWDLAVWLLETILFGRTTVQMVEKYKANDLGSNSRQALELMASEKKTDRPVSYSSYVQFLLSRRVRGKAFDRLQIDRGHLYGKVATQVNNCINFKSLGCSGSIPFSYMRKLARRMRFPINCAMRDIFNIEVMELGIRLNQATYLSAENGDTKENMADFILRTHVSDSVREEGDPKLLPAVKKPLKRDGWSPVVDVCVANALKQTSERNPRKRCSYIGREDSGMHDNIRSLTVEELAMEEYFVGVLPSCSSSLGGGGWKGWHDEGGFIRLLFRLFCTDSILVADPEDCSEVILEEATIYLSPYQSAPFDLHVAHSFYYTDVCHDNALPARSFYERRKAYLESFFNHIENLGPQQLSDAVYECAERLKNRSHALSSSANSVRQVIRTCSAIAAGLGGRALASIFRSLCFDFRHYSAGMPDLLLIRAFCPSDSTLIDLGEWIGEDFINQIKSSKLILDLINDEGLLGCSEKELKGQNERSSTTVTSTDNDRNVSKLQLVYDGKIVVVQCMLVEVKSANDSLDERQEDWLNIIDRVIPSHARVCKFTKSS